MEIIPFTTSSKFFFTIFTVHSKLPFQKFFFNYQDCHKNLISFFPWFQDILNFYYNSKKIQLVFKFISQIIVKLFINISLKFLTFKGKKYSKIEIYKTLRNSITYKNCHYNRTS